MDRTAAGKRLALEGKSSIEIKANTISVLREMLQAIDSGELDGGYRVLYACAAMGQLVAGCYEAAATHTAQALTIKSTPIARPNYKKLINGLDAINKLKTE